VELQPSDRPGEVTIVTLKRFECIEVADLDEVEGLVSLIVVYVLLHFHFRYKS
jgi:hypothetical protein